MLLFVAWTLFLFSYLFIYDSVFKRFLWIHQTHTQKSLSIPKAIIPISNVSLFDWTNENVFCSFSRFSLFYFILFYFITRQKSSEMRSSSRTVYIHDTNLFIFRLYVFLIILHPCVIIFCINPSCKRNSPSRSPKHARRGIAQQLNEILFCTFSFF